MDHLGHRQMPSGFSELSEVDHLGHRQMPSGSSELSEVWAGSAPRDPSKV